MQPLKNFAQEECLLTVVVPALARTRGGEKPLCRIVDPKRAPAVEIGENPEIFFNPTLHGARNFNSLPGRHVAVAKRAYKA